MSDSVERADELSAREAAGPGPAVMVAALQRGLRQLTRFTRLLAVSIVLDLVLTAVAVFGGYHVYLNQETSRVSCAAGNDFRIRDRALWDFVLKLPKTPGLTPAQSAVRAGNDAELRRYLDRTFAPRKCR